LITFTILNNRGVQLYRDVIFVATILSVPVIVLITWLLT
jgi:hypothetical protein